MHNLKLQQGESVIVHRGVSSPICPNAEQGKMAAHQTRDGFRSRIAGLFYGVTDEAGMIGLRFHDVSKVAVKTIGEPNGLITDAHSPFMNWWVHVVNVDGTDFGLIGRPNRKKLGGRYEPDFPHKISTTTWRRALECLAANANVDANVKLEEYAHDVRAARYPRLAASFDNSRSAVDNLFLNSI